MRAIALLLLLVAPAMAAQSGRITDAQVRKFMARQEHAWNVGDVAGSFESYLPEARFVVQARAADNSIVPYGSASLEEAKAQARRLFSMSKVREIATVTSIVVSRDGRSARVMSHETSQITTAGKTRRTCDDSVQVIVMTPSGLRSYGQTDTVVRCR